MRQPSRVLVLVFVCSSSLRAEPAPPSSTSPILAGHAVVLDGSGKLLSWVVPQDQAYGTVVRLAWDQLLTGFPVEENSLPKLTYCFFDGETLRGQPGPHNPACVYAVSYASSDHGAVHYRGAHDFAYAEKDDPRPRLGRGDGYGVIEPDKVSELRATQLQKRVEALVKSLGLPTP